MNEELKHIRIQQKLKFEKQELDKQIEINNIKYYNDLFNKLNSYLDFLE